MIDAPTRAFLVDFGAGMAFVIAVIPFVEIRFHAGGGAQAGEFAGAAGAEHGAGEHMVEVLVRQPLGELAGDFLATGRQREVGVAGVLAGK